MKLEVSLSGGCQCGAVRFSVSELGRASICYCRMCQKAFGGIGGALVSAKQFAYTRGAPAHFQSSNKVRRGFCGTCGTPLTFETETLVDLAIAAFDTPDALAPVIQLSPETCLPWVASLTSLPVRTPDEAARIAPHYAQIVSYQHPDYDTETWPIQSGSRRP